MLAFFAIVIIPGAIVFSVTPPVALLVIVGAGTPFGVITGLCAWWDFCRRRRAIAQDPSTENE
jgi:hypothetical protein